MKKRYVFHETPDKLELNNSEVVFPWSTVVCEGHF